MIVHQLLGRLDPQLIIRLAYRLRPNSEFILFGKHRLTRCQVFSDIRRLAAGLQALGVRKGDRVVTLLPACPAAVHACFLPSQLGSIHVPLNPLLGELELRHILADCAANVVITTQRWHGRDYPDLLAGFHRDLPSLQHVIVRGLDPGSAAGPPGTLPLQDVTLSGDRLRRVSVSGDDAVMISYTSGTTGQPKGVVHTHRGYWGIDGLLDVDSRRRLGLQMLRCLLLPFPPYHYAGLLGIVATLLAGGKVVLMDRFDPQEMLSLIQEEKVTQIAASPTMYRLMLRVPGQEQYDLSSVKRVTFSTEPCSFDLARALHERLGCHIENMYGTTESMLISWTDLDDPWQRAATTVGRPVPGARVKIVDVADRGTALQVGEQGEIAVHTSQMMSGYYGDPGLTSEALDADGWFYTGDVGYLAQDGYLHLTDRKKDLIIRGGENVYPAEVEAHLRRHPLVRRAAVIGVPDDVAGEAVWAYLEPEPGAHLRVREVLDFCRGQIASFKIPQHVHIVQRLPTTATGKVQKFKLRRGDRRPHDAKG